MKSLKVSLVSIVLTLIVATLFSAMNQKQDVLPENSVVSEEIVKSTEDGKVVEKKVLIKTLDLKIPVARTVQINGAITGDMGFTSGAYYAQQIRKLDNGFEPMYILLNSPGGSVIGGAQILTAMQASKSKVYTVCMQICASMAFIVHQYGEKRYMLNRAIIMSHQASTGVEGEMEKIHSLLRLLTKYLVDMEEPIARRAGITEQEYKDLVSNQLWLDANEATARKFNDAVIALHAPSDFFVAQNPPTGMFGSLKPSKPVTVSPTFPNNDQDTVNVPKDFDFVFQMNTHTVFKVK